MGFRTDVTTQTRPKSAEAAAQGVGWRPVATIETLLGAS